MDDLLLASHMCKHSHTPTQMFQTPLVPIVDVPLLSPLAIYRHSHILMDSLTTLSSQGHLTISLAPTLLVMTPRLAPVGAPWTRGHSVPWSGSSCALKPPYTHKQTEQKPSPKKVLERNLMRG